MPEAITDKMHTMICWWWKMEKGFALQRFGVYKESQAASTLKQRDYKDVTDIIVRGGWQVNRVRRLTPLETERLQGFPDNWTDIGDWTDSNGKLHKAADSPRYKAIGNSIALPFWEWMAKRMVQYIPGQATIGSLFDGIGGFPLVFQRAGATPVWASEIEEFCIAVTKERFKEDGEDTQLR